MYCLFRCGFYFCSRRGGSDERQTTQFIPQSPKAPPAVQMKWLMYCLYCLSLLFTLPVSSLMSLPLSSRLRFDIASSVDRKNVDGMAMDEASSLTSQVRRALHNSPFIEARSLVDDDVVYTSQLLNSKQLKGACDYIELSQSWNKETMPSLYCSKFCILKVAALSDKSVIVNWNVTFVSETTEALVAVFNAIPFIKIRYFDILDRERMRFCFHASFV